MLGWMLGCFFSGVFLVKCFFLRLAKGISVEFFSVGLAFLTGWTLPLF